MIFTLALQFRDHILDPAVRDEFDQLLIAIQAQSALQLPGSNVSSGTILTVDPPLEDGDMWWFFLDTATPKNLILRARYQGIPYDTILRTIP